MITTWMARARAFPAGARLGDGRSGDRLWFVRSGWLARCRLLKDGRRQIVGLTLPGEHVQPFGCTSGVAESVTALGPSEVAGVAIEEVERARTDDGKLDAWFVQAERAWSALLQERVVSLGRRNAEERLAHVLCEVTARCHVTASSAECAFPLTQSDLADYLGLSAVHVNRTLQVLRRAGLIEMGRGLLKVADLPALHRAAGFDAGYLHPQQVDARVGR